MAGTAKSPPRTFAKAIACGATPFWQQECDIGIAELLHMLAIFMQQACSAAVIVCPGITQAATSCAISATTITLATNWSALCNISILLPLTNPAPLGHPPPELPKRRVPGHGYNLLFLGSRFRHVLVEGAKGVILPCVFKRQLGKLLAVARALAEGIAMLRFHRSIGMNLLVLSC